LKDQTRTLLVLVSRAETLSFQEAHRAGNELGELGLRNQRLIINGVFTPASDDPIARAFAEKSAMAMASMPEELKRLPTTQVPFRPLASWGWLPCEACISPSPIVRSWQVSFVRSPW
jgi:arsenite-transporting ATPase